MNIFEKGEYKPIPSAFRIQGLAALQELTKFQQQFEIFDTDTTINSIRDSIIAHYLGFELLNFGKHGFDAKKSEENFFLEIKQCSFASSRWGGTWNDTNIEKAKAFSDPKLYTAVALWKGATDLQFIVYGQHKNLGEYLLERVIERKEGSRSTQSVTIDKLIKEYDFDVISPPEKTKEFVSTLLVNYSRSLANYVRPESIRSIQDV